MILAGDEMLRTQSGNNNVWCQNNETGWLDWSLVERNADMLRFVRELIALRKRHPSLQRRRFLSGQAQNGSKMSDISWHGPDGEPPDWDDPDARTLAFTLAGRDEDEEDLQVLINMSREPQLFTLSESHGCEWHLALDTTREAPREINPPDEQERWPEDEYLVAPHSLVVLEGR
jgi:glycogen operon protein